MMTVKDILQLTLPPESSVVAGHASLGREVKWATVVSSTTFDAETIEAGHCVFLLDAELPRVSLRDLISYAARVDAACLVLRVKPSSDDAALADRSALPLLVVPPETRLPELQRQVIASVFNLEAEMEMRGVQMYRQMARMVTMGRGIAAIIDQLALITGQAVALQGPRFSLKLLAGKMPAGWNRTDLEALLEDGREVEVWLANQRLVEVAPPIGKFSLRDSGLARFVAPVIAGNDVAAFVSVIGPEPELSELHRVATGRAASVSAIELSKQRAVVEAEDKVRGDFVEDLLAGNLGDREAMSRRGLLLGFSSGSPHAAVVFRLDRQAPGAERGAEPVAAISLDQLLRLEIPRRASGALVRTAADGATIIWPAEDLDEDDLKSRVESLRKYLSDAMTVSLSAGLGHIVEDPFDLPHSFREANQAVGIAQTLLGGGRSAFIDNLLVYRLIFPLQGSRELSSFYEETVGKLVDYDRRRGSELVKTLQAFLECHGNVSQAAERMFLHRNAVSYRLKRIREVTGLSLDDPEQRLALHLGLKIKDVI